MWSYRLPIFEAARGVTLEILPLLGTHILFKAHWLQVTLVSTFPSDSVQRLLRSWERPDLKSHKIRFRHEISQTGATGLAL